MWRHTRTGKINKFTGEPNWIYDFEDKTHCLVYKRTKYRWAFTSRITFPNNRWIQISSKKSLTSQEDAQQQALNSMSELKELTIAA